MKSRKEVLVGLVPLCLAVTSLVAAGEPASQTQPMADLSLPPSGPLTIMAWGAPSGADATVDRFKEFAEAGFTNGLTSFASVPQARAMLDAAQAAGVKLLPAEGGISFEEIAAALKDHPALGGYFVSDEPSVVAFPKLAETIRRIRQVDADPNRICWINLFPSCTPEQMGVENYAEYVYRFLREVPVEVLSYDCYPVKQAGVESSWYGGSLDTVAGAARVFHKPLWVFIASVGWGKTPDPNDGSCMPVPTLGGLRVQVYTNLAYGATGIEYFMYWTWKSPPPDYLKAGPIDTEGRRTPTYDMTRQINRQIQAQAGVFVGSKVEAIRYIGGSAPFGVRSYSPEAPIKHLDVGNKKAVVSLLSKGDRRFLVIVNQDPYGFSPLSLAWDPKTLMGRVAKDGSVKLLGGASLETQLDPGDACILTWKAKTK